MKELLQSIKQTLQSTPDSVCTERARFVTEAYLQYHAEPVPVKRARALECILMNMTLDLATNPVFAGNITSRPNAWITYPEYSLNVPSQIQVEDSAAGADFIRNGLSRDIIEFWEREGTGIADCGMAHLAVDTEKVLSRGLEHIIAEAESLMDRDGDRTRNQYRRGCMLACRAVMRWADRYAAAADDHARNAADPLMRKLYTRMAGACRRVPAKPARDLYEALQCMILVQYAIQLEGHGWSVTPGRVDKLLRPYYHDDPDAEELLAAYLLKLKAVPVWGSNGSAETITLGGSDIADDPAAVRVACLVLDAYETVPVADPAIYLRWHEGMDPLIREKAMDMVTRGFSMPLLSGEKETVAGLVYAGIKAADAMDYCLIGCNELGIAGKLVFASVTLYPLACLKKMIEAPGARDRYTSMERILEDLRRQAVRELGDAVDKKQTFLSRLGRERPTPFTSALMDGCLAKGTDMHGTWAYTPLNVIDRGFSNLVDSLAVLDDLVYNRRAVTLDTLADAMKADFAGYEQLLKDIRAVPRWGNDQSADRWCRRWLQLRERVKSEVEKMPGRSGLMFEHVVRSLHVVYGRQLGATPDGRRAWAPLASGVGPTQGYGHEGPTALLNSAVKLEPSRYWTGGYNLNMSLPASAWYDPAAREKLGVLVDTFLNGKGQQLQINCVDRKVLEDAQTHPENYPDLMVRIAGFNELFVALPKVEQDDVICRFTGPACGVG